VLLGPRETRATLDRREPPELRARVAARATRATLVRRGLVDLKALRASAGRQEPTARTERRAQGVCLA